MKNVIILLLLSLSFSVYAQKEPINCNNALTTIEINQCASMKLEKAQAILNQYLQASYEQNKSDTQLLAAIKQSQKEWQSYTTSHCSAIYTKWREGTIRGVMSLSCHIQKTKQRTHELWASYLTYMDSTPMILPEPEKTDDFE